MADTTEIAADEPRQMRGVTLSDSKDFELKPGEFRFNIELAKATTGDDGALYVEGVASDTGLDLEGERISLKGQGTMVEWVKAGDVILGGEADHWRRAFDDDLGQAIDARVLDGGGFYTKSRLFDWNERGKTLHKALEDGVQLGMSVFGKVTDFHREGRTPVIDGVALSRIMVTNRPVNTRTWLAAVAKSLPPEDPSTEDPAGEIESDKVETAKGLFKDALRDWKAQQADLKAFKDQMLRIEGMAFAVNLAQRIAWDLWDFEDPTAKETVDALAQVIEEAKAEIVKKAMDEAGDNAGPDLAKEVVMELKNQEGEGTEQAPEAQVPEQEPTEVATPVRVARSFAEAAKAIMADEALEPAQQKAAIATELARAASEIDDALPNEQPTGQEVPEWANRLMADLQEVKAAVETLEKANVGADEGGTPAETDDRPVLPLLSGATVAPKGAGGVRCLLLMQ
jgi:hypothetical protein